MKKLISGDDSEGDEQVDKSHIGKVVLCCFSPQQWDCQRRIVKWDFYKLGRIAACFKPSLVPPCWKLHVLNVSLMSMKWFQHRILREDLVQKKTSTSMLHCSNFSHQRKKFDWHWKCTGDNVIFLMCIFTRWLPFDPGVVIHLAEIMTIWVPFYRSFSHFHTMSHISHYIMKHISHNIWGIFPTLWGIFPIIL